MTSELSASYRDGAGVGEQVVGESTVEVHIGHIMAKLEAANRTQVAILVHDAGLS